MLKHQAYTQLYHHAGYFFILGLCGCWAQTCQVLVHWATHFRSVWMLGIASPGMLSAGALSHPPLNLASVACVLRMPLGLLAAWMAASSNLLSSKSSLNFSMYSSIISASFSLLGSSSSKVLDCVVSEAAPSPASPAAAAAAACSADKVTPRLSSCRLASHQDSIRVKPAHPHLTHAVNCYTVCQNAEPCSKLSNYVSDC